MAENLKVNAKTKILTFKKKHNLLVDNMNSLLPPITESDIGKVLGVNEDGELEFIEVSGGSNAHAYEIYDSNKIYVFIYHTPNGNITNHAELIKDIYTRGFNAGYSFYPISFEINGTFDSNKTVRTAFGIYATDSTGYLMLMVYNTNIDFDSKKISRTTQNMSLSATTFNIKKIE